MNSKKLKVYLSGPISSDPEGYKEHFKGIAEKLEALGYEVTNPSIDEYDEKLLEKGYTNKWTKDAWLEYIHEDIDLVAKHDIICLLNGWEKSAGALLELGTAKRFGLKLMLEAEDGFIDVQESWNVRSVIEFSGGNFLD